MLGVMYADGDVASFNGTENPVQPEVRVDSLDCSVSDTVSKRSFGVVQESAKFAEWNETQLLTRSGLV